MNVILILASNSFAQAAIYSLYNPYASWQRSNGNLYTTMQSIFSSKIVWQIIKDFEYAIIWFWNPYPLMPYNGQEACSGDTCTEFYAHNLLDMD